MEFLLQSKEPLKWLHTDLGNELSSAHHQELHGTESMAAFLQRIFVAEMAQPYPRSLAKCELSFHFEEMGCSNPLGQSPNRQNRQWSHDEEIQRHLAAVSYPVCGSITSCHNHHCVIWGHRVRNLSFWVVITWLSIGNPDVFFSISMSRLLKNIGLLSMEEDEGNHIWVTHQYSRPGAWFAIQSTHGKSFFL